MERNKDFILKRVAEEKEYVQGIRRWRHENLEVSGKEFDTSAMILKEIEALGLPYEKAATNGYVVTMECGKPGKTIVLRCDIDALPVPEEADNLCTAVSPSARVFPTPAATTPIPL